MFTVVTVIMSLLIASLALMLQAVAFMIPPLFSRLRLTYDYNCSVPLINANLQFEGLRVMVGRKSVADPHVVQLKLSNPGRGDVPSSSFDKAAPLRFDLKANVVAVIRYSWSSESSPRPAIDITDTKLSIGPSKIPSRSGMELVLLIDGPCTSVACEDPLINVTLERQGDNGDNIARGLSIKQILGWAAVAFAIWWLIEAPAGAAHLVHDIGTFLSSAAAGISNFFASL